MIENLKPEFWTKENLNEYQIFDVRSPKEWQEEGLLKQAKCLFLYDNEGLLNQNFINDFNNLFEKEKKLAFICRSGYRSKLAADLIADKLGIMGVNLDGGMQALSKSVQ
ncbi:rhodanese-like domain-containing protein [Campylobacter sp. MIT 21-1685]|uniref:rhodanese-like domain-containing protein n=1 Tax=unclassified Campylobacter TaxID=2593542 RepID=UPI00224AAB74|nr:MULTISPECIES: rhodanese-like domain-containing protein [unclassified Campylobacter]MCX2682565.1 rhodanese-like domain-containing protein [Campylobacter sp. MIT 21-1684]MCX2750722.1 rhodanese-like domain-containing protein [Campylobacter sp. MIT 21-1682]MCX2807046.1 rhodanese-like domain-containing protein [Campylobacter sp. MIT 21-1685]